MKLVKNSVSISLEEEFNKLKISKSKRGVSDADFDKLAIIEWMMLKNENQDFFQTLKAFILLSKKIKGFDILLEETAQEIGTISISVDDFSKDEISDYTKTIAEIVKETEKTFEFLEECEIDIDSIEDSKKNIVVLDSKEYIKLKQNAHTPMQKEKDDNMQKIEKKQENNNTILPQAKKLNGIQDSNIVQILISNYNKYRIGEQ